LQVIVVRGDDLKHYSGSKLALHHIEVLIRAQIEFFHGEVIWGRVGWVVFLKDIAILRSIARIVTLHFNNHGSCRRIYLMCQNQLAWQHPWVAFLVTTKRLLRFIKGIA